jgi:Ca-activated chloride channel homolog
VHTWSRWGLVLLILLSSAGFLSGCGSSGTGNELTVLAGSELKDLEPLFKEIRKNTGLSLSMTYIGTLDGAEKLIAGEQVDLAWFSHAKYLSLLQGASNRIAAQTKIMLSPVVLGVKQSKAEVWGWTGDSDVTWQDVVDKATAGELRFGMTNPTASNTGFSALVGVASALAGSADALQLEDIERIRPDLQGFFRGQALAAGSSGWLAESYVREQDQLDGLINYESVLLALNRGGELREKLFLVYPREGIITADYPLLLINRDKLAAYDRLVAYLLSPEFQQKLMEQTLRRPVNAQVAVIDAFPKQFSVELPFPNSQKVVDALLFSYLDEQRRPAHTYYVLDVSGSMRGERLDALKAALNNLTGTDTSLTGQFARFQNRERVTLMPFSDDVLDMRTFEVDLDNPQSFQEIRTYVDGLVAKRSTAIYSALYQAYTYATLAQKQDPDRYFSIVLMSDGKNNAGILESELLHFYRSLPAEAQRIKTFAILFGEAEKEALQRLTAETGGRLFDAKSEPLSLIFKQIRGYQ